MIKRILLVWSVLSTITAIAMNKDQHIVTIKNFLTQSSITIINQTQCTINGKMEIDNHSTVIYPQEKQQFQLTSQNNMTNLQLMLPSCYDAELVDINITQKKEVISIIPHDKSEETIRIHNNSQEKIATIKALMDPAQYHKASSLLLERLHTKLQPHHRVTIENHIKKDVNIGYSLNTWTHDPNTLLALENLITYQTVESGTQSLLSVLVEEGKAPLLFILPNCDSKEIPIYLNEKQKKISIIKGDASNDIKIVDENNCQLAWTFIVLNSQK